MKTLMMFLIILSAASLSDAAGTILNSTFEDGSAGGWTGRGSTVVSVTGEAAHDGSRSLLATDRSESWNGPSIDMTGKISAAASYRMSVWVMIKKGQPESDMILSVERVKGGKASWDRVGLVHAKTGVWTSLAGEYRAKGDFDRITVYIESPDGTLEYYIDDVTIESAGPPAQGASVDADGLDESVPALYEVYKDSFQVGTCAELSQLTGREGDMIKKHFSSITAENVMKPQYLAPAEGKYFFDDADKLVEFAVKNGKRVRGHTLVWHEQNAKWMFVDSAGKRVSKEVLLKRLENYIKTVVGRYKGKVYAWDVVNEVLDMGDFRYSDWYEIAGEEFIEKAFIYAHEADPDAKLFLNEVDTTEKHKEKALYDLVKSLREKKVPVDGIGMQFHISLDYPSIQSVSDSLKKFDELGLEIHITELDMSINADPGLKADKAEEYQLLLQGYRYKELLRVFREHRSVTSVTFWGFHDGHTWLTYFPVKKADWPLLFDKSLRTKYAFWGIVDPSKLPKEVEGGPKKKNLIARAVRGTPVLDGREDAVWKKAPVNTISVFVMGNGATGTGKVLWDDRNLYVFIKVKDRKLSRSSANAYEQDSVEIFIDEKNNKSIEYMDDDAQYRISYVNEVTLNGFPSKIQSKAVRVKGGYNVEVMIPFKEIKPSPGTEIGFDLQINDDPGSGKRGSIAKWNDPTNESYRNTSGFGTLVLE